MQPLHSSPLYLKGLGRISVLAFFTIGPNAGEDILLVYDLTHNAMVVISRSVNPPALFLGKLPADNQYLSAKLSAATDNCHLSAVLIEMTRMREAYSNTSFHIWSRILATIFAILLPTDTGAEDRCLLAGQMSFLERDVPGREGWRCSRALSNTALLLWPHRWIHNVV